MEMIYNEFSSIPLSANEAAANQKVVDFIGTYTEAVKKGFKKIRFPVVLENIQLCDHYSVKDWLLKSPEKKLKELLLGARVYPEWVEGDVKFEEEYSKNSYCLKADDPKVPKTTCSGLASAFIHETLSVSMQSHEFWKKSSITISRKNEENNIEDEVPVKNVFSSGCFANESIKAFVEKISDLELVKTSVSPKLKPIHFRDDHGNDVLKEHADLLVKSPYVISVINSLPWKNRELNYIKQVFSNGIVYIRLHKTDRGLGMAIQTTGRNLRETGAIARLLKDEFDR